MIGNHPAVPLHGAFAFDTLNQEKQCFEAISDMSEKLSVVKTLSPIEWANADQAPCCIIAGDADIVVPAQQSERLAQKMKDVGGAFELKIIPGGTHDMDTVGENITPAINWFEKHLGTHAAGSR